jgi:hypothetical protein
LGPPLFVGFFVGFFTDNQYLSWARKSYTVSINTVPLLMTVGGLIPEDKEWLREAVGEYIEEEMGHQEWVLNDIAACGYDKEQARRSVPAFATEMMVSYAYDAVRRTSPLAFFGMVLVLEGTSIALAEKAAARIAGRLQLPRKAFTYLSSHGALDQDHIKFYESLMNRIIDPADQAVIIHAARRFYRLYGDVYRSLEEPHGLDRLPEAA